MWCILSILKSSNFWKGGGVPGFGEIMEGVHPFWPGWEASRFGWSSNNFWVVPQTISMATPSAVVFSISELVEQILLRYLWERRWLREVVERGGWEDVAESRWLREQVVKRGCGWESRWLREDVVERAGGWESRWLRAGGWEGRWLREQLQTG